MPVFESVAKQGRAIGASRLTPRLVLPLSCPSQLSAIVSFYWVNSLGLSKRQKSPPVLSGRAGMIPLKRDVTDRDGACSHLDSAPLPPPTRSPRPFRPTTYNPQNPHDRDGIQSCQQESAHQLTLRPPVTHVDPSPSAHEGVRCHAKRTAPLHLGRTRREEYPELCVMSPHFTPAG